MPWIRVGGGGGGLHFRVAVDRFTGADLAACRVARGTYFTTTSPAAFRRFAVDRSLAIILDPASSTDNTFETYVGGATAYDDSMWVERTDAVEGNPGEDGSQGRFPLQEHANGVATPTVAGGGTYDLATGTFTPSPGATEGATAPGTGEDVYAREAYVDPAQDSGVVDLSGRWSPWVERAHLSSGLSHVEHSADFQGAGTAGDLLRHSPAFLEQLLEVGRRSEFHTGGFTFNRTYLSSDFFGSAHALEQIAGLASHGNIVYAISPNGLVGGTDGSLQDIRSTIPTSETIVGFARVDTYAFVTTDVNIYGYRVAGDGSYTRFYFAGVAHVVSADVFESIEHTLVVMRTIFGQVGQLDGVEFAFYTISETGLGVVQTIRRTLSQINTEFSSSFASYDEFRVMSVADSELYVYVIDDYHVRTLRYDISGSEGSRSLTANPDGGHNTTWEEFLTGVVRDSNREYIASRFTAREYLRDSSELDAVLAAIRSGMNVTIDRSTAGRIIISASGAMAGVDLAAVLAAILPGANVGIDRSTAGQITITTSGTGAALGTVLAAIMGGTGITVDRSVDGQVTLRTTGLLTAANKPVGGCRPGHGTG